MGTLTRLQMETDLKFRYPISNRADIDTQLTLAIQYAYDELVTSLRIPENQETAVLQTSDGIATVAAPDDFYAPVSIRNMTDGERLQPMTPREYDAIKDITTTGQPTRYSWWRNEITWFPTPNSTARVFQMRYLKRLPPLSTSSTVSALPREWDEIIVQSGLCKLCSWLGLKPEAQSSLLELNLMIAKRIDRRNEFYFDPPTPAEVITSGPTWP